MASPASPPAAHHANRLPLLDGLRGAAAILVMLYHANNLFQISPLFSRGYLFVDFFFLLSGFVLTLAAEPKMALPGGTLRFLRARVLRLWPTICLGIAAGVIEARLAGLRDGMMALIALAVLMIPSNAAWGLEIFPLNPPQWSLLCEWLANIAHGLVLRRIGTATLLCAIAFFAAAEWLVIVKTGANMRGPDKGTWYFALPRVAFAYTLGIVYGRIWRRRAWPPLASAGMSFAAPVLWVLVLPLLACTPAAGDALTVLLVVPALFWIAAVARPAAGAVPWLGRLGAISFPLYAIHLPILRIFALSGSSPALAAGAIGSALLLAVAMAWAGSATARWRAARIARAEPQAHRRPATA